MTTAVTPMPGWASHEASMTGLDAARMQALVDATGNPPAPQDLFQMIRRQIINEAQLEQGLREGDTRDEWIPLVSRLRYVQPSPIDMVRAAVQNQMTYGESAQWAETLGLEPAGYLNGNPDWFALLYDVHGRPPGPVEMGHAANRGIIPWQGTGATATTFQQAISESDIKDKWEPILRQLAVYFPPPGTVHTLLVHGAITEDQAIALWQQGGVSPEMAQAFSHVATVEQVTTDKALAKGEILQLVQEQAITDAEATDMLARVGYGTDNAPFLIEMAHLRYELQILRTAINNVARQYVAHKVTGAAALNDLQALGLQPEQANLIMQTLSVQRAGMVSTLTAGEIADLYYYSIADEATCMQMLQNLGYSAWDAWAIISIRAHGKQPNEPPMPAGNADSHA